MLDVGETLVKWEPIEGISFDFISAEVFSTHTDLWVRLIDGRVDVPEHHDLILHFSRVAGFTVHEEFAHPTREPFGGANRLFRRNIKGPSLVLSSQGPRGSDRSETSSRSHTRAQCTIAYAATSRS